MALHLRLLGISKWQTSVPFAYPQNSNLLFKAASKIYSRCILSSWLNWFGLQLMVFVGYSTERISQKCQIKASKTVEREDKVLVLKPSVISKTDLKIKSLHISVYPITNLSIPKDDN